MNRGTTNRRTTFGMRTLAASVGGAALVLGPSAGGCANGYQGAASGAGLGALAGMGIGSLSGNMGKGAAAGAIIGGVGGAILGDQNNRNDRRSGVHNDW
jgi:hypothetical protein